jgi:fatty acyl-CoA reductase
MSKQSNVFLTGVTGFVGKVVLEELLRRSNELNIDKVYVLIRQGKNRKTGEKILATERFEKEVLSSECFNNLPSDYKKHITVVQGDLSVNELGVEKTISFNIQNKITHIINCAASVEFDLPLEEAASSNITSALNVLEFSRSCSKLISFVNVSTAYVSPHPGDGVLIPEKLVNLPFDPEVVYQSILSGSANEKELMAKTGHPNTYTFTKCLSEHLLHRYKGNIPLAIVRPSIISSSWKEPRAGWIDSYAAFAGFVSLIGAGLLKCVDARENTILDIVSCDEVSNRVIDSTFWTKSQERPFIQHIVSGLNKGCRVDTCISGIESYFQRNPVNRFSKIKYISNSKPIALKNMIHHKIPANLAGLWFNVSGQQKQGKKVKSLLNKMEYLNRAFPYFTHNSFNFEVSTPISMILDSKQYIELVCSGVYENLMKKKVSETSFAGSEHKHYSKDLTWVYKKNQGNWAIRTASYIVRKGLRKCTNLITFDRKSFEDAMKNVNSDGLLVIVPSHRSYMDFLLCSYLFFSHPELNIPIPRIAAANDFSKIPFLGWFFQQTYAFYIKRGQGKEDPELSKNIQDLVDKNQTLEFFIEGARSRSRQFLKPKRGLLRALQNTGIHCSILPISISYDLVPEEKSFLTELRTLEKKKMKFSSLLKWTSKMIAGNVNLGRVHIVCGNPINMGAKTNVHNVSKNIMKELQDKTVISDFHLKAFLHYNKIPNIDIEWLKNSLLERNACLINSPLTDVSLVDPLTEKTMRYHWIHYFYSDIISFEHNNPILEYHIKENAYFNDIYTNKPILNKNIDNKLGNLLKSLFEPIFVEYKRILDLAKKNNGNLPDAKSIINLYPDSFLPFIEEALSLLKELKIIEINNNNSGFVKGDNWSEIDKFYSYCSFSQEKILESRFAL